MSTSFNPDAIEHLARKRAAAKLGWFIHASAYVAVNSLLLLISLYQGKAWVVFPLLGWGLGLALHGAAVWLASPGNALLERLVERERLNLAAQRDPW